ncbi:MAG TPA: alkaline phosphatase family protein [Terriglobales bacterium]|nr:alkaline phosphatase family protein [Terriglobales bacterium]
MSQRSLSRPMSRRDFMKVGAAATAALSAGARSFVPKVYGRARATKKVIVLGMDGLDHGLVGRWMDEGKLPTFRRLLAEGGDFRPLRTSIPPQTPVAWSNFITGTDPGGHGIFDFFLRDPRNLDPAHILNFSATETTGSKHTVRIGRAVLPLSGGTVRNLRGGRAFWQVLEEREIPSAVIRMPSNYPPSGTRQRTLAGMNTPDIKGRYNTFNYYTNESKSVTEDAGNGGYVHDVFVVGNRVEAKLPGPNNSFRADNPEMEIDFQVFIDPANAAAKIVIQDQEFILKEKEWSGWKRVSFSLFPTQSVNGICQFYLKEVRPKFKLYIGSIHIDPGRPALPISTPESYSRELERRFGPFFTKGLPADTAALDNDILDEEEFLGQDDFVLRESLEQLDYELGRFNEGLFFYYFSSTDQRQHMFWRLIDPDHPSYDPKLAARYGNVIENIYIEMDQVLDKVLRKVDKDTLLLCMSDHGFNPFRRAFNLNTWLLQNGYHRLVKPWKQEESLLFDNTDWAKTRAFGVGLNGLYINERGREHEGIVAPGPEKDNLVREIARKLEALTDPKTGEPAILHAYVAKDIYHGPYVDKAPDIVLGFNRNYRISWQSPLGGFPKEILEDNTKKWSGDHMTAPDVIPGIVFANRKIRAEAPALYDLTATVLDLFGAEKPKEIIGTTIL